MAATLPESLLVHYALPLVSHTHTTPIGRGIATALISQDDTHNLTQRLCHS